MKKFAFILAFAAMPALAQHEMHGMEHGAGMQMTEIAGWRVMIHGSAFLNATSQTGPRGRDQVFSTNWAMASADRPLFDGRLTLRSMISLEPLFMPQRGYAELFQTGETAHGVPIVDSQHPHDFLMELAAQYDVDLGNNTSGFIYAAPVGAPALGPVAYPHRASAQELPQATLSHHLQDSTHIANSVVTIGGKRGPFSVAFSGFHGQEPDENRWDVDGGAIDSWSVRGTWDPSPNLQLQLSTGHLVNPESQEPGNVQRTTASAQLQRGNLATSLIWGHNQAHGRGTDGITAEANWKFLMSNYLTGRFELVDKDFTIAALTVGYTKDLFRSAHLLGGVGGNITFYDVPSGLKSEYGSPRSYLVFVRVRGNS
ncbi:MAG TPA: hypothetical protein VJ032_15015 [Thermoanaerobaculia bacterium]|nr:hypothetical protein [Thermoanaerobaculia bacterium]